MPRDSFTLTDANILGLFFINRYRFLTISQFARISGLSKERSEKFLLALFRSEIVGSFGNVALPGAGRTPKVYFLKRRGWELLRAESGIPEEMLGSYSEVHQEASWSTLMQHRLKLLDVMIAAELAVRVRPHLNIVRSFLEYRRIKREGRLIRKTTDYVAAGEALENKIVPDGALILENVETGNRALFLIEMDMGSERIVANITHDRKLSLHFRFEQYDRYLTSMRFAEKYKGFGEFDHFTLLFVALSSDRLTHVREALADLASELHSFYRFGLFSEVVENFLGEAWLSRLPTDRQRYRLVRG